MCPCAIILVDCLPHQARNHRLGGWRACARAPSSSLIASLIFVDGLPHQVGGVHAPVRVVQMYLMLASKLTTRFPLAANLHYVTLLREPTRRFISEFYETNAGWEVRFGTPPQLSSYEACSARLPHELRRRAIGGIDNASKAAYDELFPHWIRCPTNMGANRQTRALSFNHLSQPNSTGGLRRVLQSISRPVAARARPSRMRQR